MAPKISREQPNPSNTPFLDRLHATLRFHIYTTLIKSSPSSNTKTHPISSTCRQIRDEFLSAYDYHTKARFRCCLGRTAKDREITRFYTWNHDTNSSGAPIEVTPKFVESLEECTVRCTIESLRDFDQRSWLGAEVFQDCIQLLIKTFKGCKNMQRLRIEFDHFVLSGKKGLLRAEGVLERVKDIFALPGATSIKFTVFGDTLSWTMDGNHSGKKGKKAGAGWVMKREGDTWLYRRAAPGSPRGD